MSYTIIFNSQGSNATVGATNASVSYNINWGSIIDPKYKKFNCEFVFKSLTTTSLRLDNGFVNLNLGNTKIYDGQSMTQNIGFIYPVSLSTTQSFYTSTNNDNNDFVMNYPTNNVITINLNLFSGVNQLGFGYANTMPHYVMILTMHGIEENNKENHHTDYNKLIPNFKK
jgi:hypothetical protein